MARDQKRKKNKTLKTPKTNVVQEMFVIGCQPCQSKLPLSVKVGGSWLHLLTRLFIGLRGYPLGNIHIDSLVIQSRALIQISESFPPVCFNISEGRKFLRPFIVNHVNIAQ